MSVAWKFLSALALALSWSAFSIWAAQVWFEELSAIAGWPVALFVIAFVAIVPGFMNAFLVASLVLDRRPPRARLATYPDVTVLVAAYNESGSIAETLRSIARQDYPAHIDVVVVDDGSHDTTTANAKAIGIDLDRLRVITLDRNGGKAAALNAGLVQVHTDWMITVDADCYIAPAAVRHLVERFAGDSPGTRAVAGAMLVRNSRDNWITRAQEWDYFQGIAATKRVQSLYHGVLVAQGAFSIYDTATLREVGGWPDAVGEDIVLTWMLLARGYRIGHAEDACAFTSVPATLGQFLKQRRRWARGMIEAFRRTPEILVKLRLSTMFILWNTLFPLLDIAYVLAFMPGIVLALFGHFWIVGPMTVALLPVGLAMNAIMFRIESRTFTAEGFTVRKNPSGFVTYALAYGLVLQPASVLGYFSEFLNLRRTWGTK